MNNTKFDYNFYKKATESARGTKAVNSPSVYFGAFRALVRKYNESLRNDYEKMQADLAEMAETLNERTLTERKAEREEAFSAVVKSKQEILSNVLEKLCLSKKDAIRRFTLIPPKQENILKIELADKRFENISETEWLMLSQETADNYQESAYLASIAKKHGIDYAISYDPETEYNNIDELETRIKQNIVPYISKDPMETIELSQFCKYEEGRPVYGRINQLAKHLDDLPLAIVEEPILELSSEENFNNRLKDAKYRFWKGNSKSLWEECLDLTYRIQKNGLSTESLTKGERLIKLADELFPNED